MNTPTSAETRVSWSWLSVGREPRFIRSRLLAETPISAAASAFDRPHAFDEREERLDRDGRQARAIVFPGEGLQLARGERRHMRETGCGHRVAPPDV